jgi:RNA polymerase-interacting CarD/CdnL/TRCF family regulator
MAWRREQKRSLTIEGKRLYDRAIHFLSAEIASLRRSDPDMVEAEISQVLYSQRQVV